MFRLDHEHRIDVVAESHRLHVVETAHEQSGADEQHHRQRALEHEQRDARARPMVRAFARAGLEVAGEVDAPRLQRPARAR